jgi:hypothetical protein
MGIALRSNKPQNSAGTGSTMSITVGCPSDIESGDLIVACIGTDNQGGLTITPPDGSWTEQAFYDSGTGGGQCVGLYTKVAGGSEPATYTFDSDAYTGYISFGIGLYEDSGGSVDSPYNGQEGEDTSGSTHTTSSITTTTDNDWVISIVVQDQTGSDGNFVVDSPAGLTEITEAWGAASNLGVHVAYEERTSAGSGAHQWTQTGGGDNTRGSGWGMFAVTFTAGGSTYCIVPDADITTTGWSSTPLWSKLNDGSDATVVTATAS